MKHKLENFVNFPIHDLDLTNYVANKNNGRRQLYELYALSNHYGGMGSGHYTAHIKVFYLVFLFFVNNLVQEVFYEIVRLCFPRHEDARGEQVV